tara:strand:- start:10683 stop:11945 length:1263 start_codon:yes stop_codon:yes gene_type:complete
MKLDTDPYKGVRDFYPDDKARLTALFAIVQDVLAKYGYSEYDASPLERAELYESKTSEEIVNEQTYTFTDRGDRKVTLRPEMTPTLARMAAAKRRELPFPLRWYSIGNRFRYERPQKGRLREFYQVDVDLVGAPEGEADLEVIRVGRDVLRAFGAGDETFSIRINSRKLLTAACKASALKDEDHASYMRLLDRKNKMEASEFEEKQKELVGDGKDPLACIDGADDSSVKEEKEKLETFIATLKERGIENVVYDPTLVRGFDYYTGVIFEFFDTDPSNARALFGGGRYDNLLSLFSNDEIPAVGFAFGDVTLQDFLETHDLLPEVDFSSHIYLATPSEENIPAAQAFANELREQGLSVFVNLSSKKIGDQIKDAEKRNITHVIVYGEDEAKSSMVTLKNIETGDELETKKENILDLINESL